MTWYRTFGITPTGPDPADLLEHLRGRGHHLVGNFRGDDQGWFGVEFKFADGAVVSMDRYLSTEEGIRAELNAWAAWLETIASSPHRQPLMEHMIRTTQLFTLMLPVEVPERFGNDICQFLAQQTGGAYQVDGYGIFAADGAWLVKEESADPDG